MTVDKDRDYFIQGEELIATDCMSAGYGSPKECAENTDLLSPSKGSEPVSNYEFTIQEHQKPTDRFNILAPTTYENRAFAWEFADLVENGEFAQMDAPDKVKMIERMDYIVTKTADLTQYTADERSLNKMEEVTNSALSWLEGKLDIKLGEQEVDYKYVLNRANEVLDAYNSVRDQPEEFGLTVRNPTFNDTYDEGIGAGVIFSPSMGGATTS